MRVLVIPEDFRRDQHVLQPFVTALLKSLQRPAAKVDVYRKVRFGGVARALSFRELERIVVGEPTVDLFLLLVDRDDEPDRRAVLDHLEARLRGCVKPGALFLGENAWQEVEVWTLAGHDLPSEWRWAAVRSERDPKERYFEPFARTRGLQEEEDGGRRKLSEEAARRFGRVYRLCREDVQVLHARIGAWMAGVTVPDHATALAGLPGGRR